MDEILTTNLMLEWMRSSGEKASVGEDASFHNILDKSIRARNWLLVCSIGFGWM